MQKINIIALGGASENGKNLYVIEYAKKYLVVDCGIAPYDNVGIGIDRIVPDLSFLDNKEIVGCIISHGHLDQMGAVSYLLNRHPNLQVYGSKFTIEFLKLLNISEKHLKIINYDQELKLKDFTIEPFRLSHAIFGNYGYVINTPFGAVVYATDYNFNQAISENERTDIEKIIALKNKYAIKVLMTEVVDVENIGVASSNQEEIKKFKLLVKNSVGRTIVSLYSSNVTGINNVIQIAESLDKKICIFGRDLLSYVNISRRLGLITHSRDRFIKTQDLKSIPPEKQLIIVSGLNDEPFKELQKIARGENNFLKIKQDDTVIIASSPHDKIEGFAQEVGDELARTYATIIPQRLNTPSHAYQEDIKMMINLFNPQFILPIKGEYRKQITLLKLATSLGYDESQVIIQENGQIIEVTDKKAVCVKSFKMTDMLVKNTRDKSKEINPIVMYDREMLSQNGYVTIILPIDSKTEKLIDKPIINSGGNSSFNDNQEIMEGVTKLVNNIFEDETSEFNKKQGLIRAKVNRFLENNINKSPMILSIRLEV